RARAGPPDDLARRGVPPRRPRADRAERRRAGPPRSPAQRDPGVDRVDPGCRGRRRAADLAPVAADERLPRRRGDDVPDARGGAERGAGGGAAALQGAAHPRRRAVNADLRTAAELADALGAGETTSVEITQAHLDRIAEVDGDVHAFLHVDAEGA